MQSKLTRDKGAVGLEVPPGKRRASAADHLYFYGRYARKAVGDPNCIVDPDLYCLTNFSHSPMVLDGLRYATVEHYYQSQKFVPLNADMAERVRTAATPRIAKALASQTGAALIRGDWFDVNLDVMRIALLAKFTQNEPLRRKLLATAPAVLHEDSPKDMFWGALGQDWLGRLLMETRDKLAVAAEEADAIADLDYFED